MFVSWHRDRRQEIPRASLADIAFLLLIFFIASTTFAIERGLPLVLPSARRAVALSVRPADVFRIQGRADGTVTANGKVVRIAELAPLLRAGNSSRRDAGREEYVVLIETDPQAEYRLMVDVLDQVRLADCRRVALKLLEPAEHR
jgi:biopolymer transport protein ExbD